MTRPEMNRLAARYEKEAREMAAALIDNLGSHVSVQSARVIADFYRIAAGLRAEAAA